MIGKNLRVRRVVVLAEGVDGVQHGFDFDGADVRWEITGYGAGSDRWAEGAHGRLTINGRMHRKSIDPELQQRFDTLSEERDALPPARKELPDAQ